MSKFTTGYTLLAAGLLQACASNEELFAEYDAYCQGTACPTSAPEIIYQEVEVLVPAETKPWEPAVYFGYDMDQLESKETARLQSNLEVLESNPGFKISLQAFTDSVATFNYNAALAERRRLTVVNFFVDNGVAEERIISSSGGELMPVLPSDSANDRIINRRVEMMLLDDTGRPVSFEIQLPEQMEQFVPPFPAEKID